MSEQIVINEQISSRQLIRTLNFFSEESYSSPSIEFLINGEKVNCPIIIDKLVNTIRINIKTNGDDPWKVKVFRDGRPC